MCKISLKSYEKLSSSTDKLRMRPNAHKNITVNNSHSNITNENDYNGPEHYTTTYNKTSQPQTVDDSKYETTLIDFRFVKDDSGINELIRIFVNKMMTKYAGQTAIRRSFQMLNLSGSGIISIEDFTSSLHMLGIWIYTKHDFNLFYTKLAGGVDKMITYMSFKEFIEKQNEFIRCCEL